MLAMSGDVVDVCGIEYTLDKLLYSRNDSWLYTAFDAGLSEQVVLKRVPRVGTNEIDIHRTVTAHRVPNCLRLLHASMNPDQDFDIMVFPYVGCGDMWTQVQVYFHRGMDESQVCKVLRNVLTALLALKQLTIIHHDVSLENMLVDDDGTVMLCDFGLSVYERDVKDARAPHVFVQGKVNYIAPELYYKPNKHHDLYTADVWSLGVCAFMMLTGEMPYSSIGDDAYDDLTLYGARVLLAEQERKRRKPISSEAKDLVSSMLVVEPQKRLRMDQIDSHPFFTGRKVYCSFWSKVTVCVLQTVHWLCRLPVTSSP